MKKFLLTCFMVSATAATAQNTIYSCNGYEKLTYGRYSASNDGWSRSSGSANYNIVENGFDNSDMCLELLGLSTTNTTTSTPSTSISKSLTDIWDAEMLLGNYILTIDFEIRNNTPANSTTLNTLQFELFNREMDPTGKEKDTALYGVYFGAASGELRTLYGKGTDNAFSWIGTPNTNGYKAARNEWTNVRIIYNTKTGYAEFKYGNKLFIETGTGKGDGGNLQGLGINYDPSPSYISTSPLANKKPGMIRFITRAGGRVATDTAPGLDNTSAAIFSIDNLVVTASGPMKTLSTEDIIKEDTTQKVYIDHDKNLVINPNIEVNDLQVFDNNGKLVAATQNHNQVALQSLASGVYVVKYSDKKGVYSKRIIK